MVTAISNTAYLNQSFAVKGGRKPKKDIVKFQPRLIVKMMIFWQGLRSFVVL
jgi:hypothetical protein